MLLITGSFFVGKARQAFVAEMEQVAKANALVLWFWLDAPLALRSGVGPDRAAFAFVGAVQWMWYQAYSVVVGPAHLHQLVAHFGHRQRRPAKPDQQSRQAEGGLDYQY